MKLTDYLRDERITAAEFGRRIGVKSRMAVLRYCNGDRIPRPDVMVRIVEVTRGAVQPNDFFVFAPPDADAPTRDGLGADDGVGGVSAAGPVQPDQEAA